MPGRTIDRYELIEQLRAEPDRASFKARDTHTGQVVVLHLFRQAGQLTSPRDLQAFAELMHPNLLAIWNTGTFDEEGRLTPFVVTPLLDGVALEDIIRQARAPLTTEWIGDFALQACEGLEALHEHNLVHGHLTPGSLLITDRGLVTIIDFGLLARSPGVPVSPYTAPELVVDGRISAASDIYSFGVILYEALTLTNPFARPQPEAVGPAIIHDIPPPVSTVNAAVSEAISGAIQTAMAKDPARRFASARIFGEVLHSALRNEALQRSESERRHSSIQRAKKALAENDLTVARESIRELEIAGAVDFEVVALRDHVERQSRQEEIRRLLEKARSDLEARDYGQAIRYVEETLSMDANPEAIRLQKEIQGAKERKEQIDRVRTEQEQLYRSALTSYQEGDIESALATAERVIDLMRSTPEPTSGGLESLYEYFYRQLRHERESLDSAYAKARRLLAEEKFQEALETSARQSARTPNDQRLRALMREIEQQERHSRAAFVEDITRRIEIERDVERRLAILTDAVRRYPGEATFQQSLSQLRQRRELIEAILAKVRELEALGQYSEALQQIKILGTVDPQSPAIDVETKRITERHDQQLRWETKNRLLEQVNHEAQSGDFVRALEILRVARAEFPDDPDIARVMASAEEALDYVVAERHQQGDWVARPEDSPAPPPVPALDNVHFTITVPSRLEAGGSFELYFWVHLNKQRKTVLDRAMLAIGATKPEQMFVKSEGPVPLPRGTVVSARVSIEGLQVDPNEKSLAWSGEAGCASFVAAVPPGMAQRRYHGTVSIRVNSCEIARMDFLLRVEGKSGKIPAKLRRHATAFASCASQDRDAVLARLGCRECKRSRHGSRYSWT